MDHKEKLAELLYEAMLIEGSGRDLCEKIAEHLIANGVTVQDGKDNNVPAKWVPVAERLPERKCDYLTSRKGDVYVEFWNGVLFSERNHHGQPTHWMPLPEPPKGERA